MSKKFARMIAERIEIILNESKHDTDTIDECITNTHQLEIMIIADKIADIFESDNPHFNRERFLKACGLSENS